MNIIQPRGVGAELKRLLLKWGIKEDGKCNCWKFAQLMNRKGPDWCEENLDRIVKRLRIASNKQGRFFQGWIAKRFVVSAIERSREVVDISRTFDAIHCVNLDRRPDRWAEFEARIPDDWPFIRPERYSAIDARKIATPDWWSQGRPAWGCYRSHLNLIENALNTGKESILLLEDDATFVDGFSAKAKAYIEALPSDWGMAYFGGQHLFVGKHPPLEVNPLVYRPYNINRTHAFAIRGAEMLKKVYQHLQKSDWHKGNHIDHHLGRLHQKRQDPIYAPHEWLIGQAEGQSNISGKVAPERFWKPAVRITEADPQSLPFVAVLGTHSSGSSCLAGVLYHLGFYLGDKLVGYYGQNPDANCGFEAAGLMEICEGAIPFPDCEYQWKRDKIWSRLRGFLNQKRRQAHEKNTLAVGKYPQLCQLGRQLTNICGEHLLVVAIDRPLEDSIESLKKRCPGKDAAKLEAHQRWLNQGKESLLESTKHVRIDYYSLLDDPDGAVDRIADFFEPHGLDFLIDPELLEQGKERVRNWVSPEKRHVG